MPRIMDFLTVYWWGFLGASAGSVVVAIAAYRVPNLQVAFWAMVIAYGLGAASFVLWNKGRRARRSRRRQLN